MSAAFAILRVAPETADVLRNVAEDVFDSDIDPARLAGFLAAPGHALFVAVSANAVVGQARGIVHRQPDGPPQLYIDNLGVAPERQREGVASALLAALLDWSRGQGCESFWVATERDNAPARALYAGLDAAEKDLVWFERALTPAPGG